MTNRRVGVSVGIGLRDPRSQKRDLGHPSISPFDIAEGISFVIALPTRLSESAGRDEKGLGPAITLYGAVALAFFFDRAERPAVCSVVPNKNPRNNN
jgi:hypothetical protein